MVFYLDEFLNCCFEPTFAIAIPEIPAPTIKTSRFCLETFFFDLKVKGRAGSSIIRPMTIPTSSQNCRMISTQLLIRTVKTCRKSVHHALENGHSLKGKELTYLRLRLRIYAASV